MRAFAWQALELEMDEELVQLASAFNGLVVSYDKGSWMNTELANQALCLGRHELAERLCGDDLLVDWELLDEFDLSILRDDKKAVDLLDLVPRFFA